MLTTILALVSLALIVGAVGAAAIILGVLIHFGRAIICGIVGR